MKEISLHWCPTKEMIADFWTKPLQGSHFRKLRDYIMGRVRCVKPKGDAVSVKTKVSGLCRSAKGGIGGRKIMPQQFDDCCGTGVCWGLYSYGMSMDRPYLGQKSTS